MFHRQGLRRLPLDIRLEVEMLLSDLRGERSLSFRPGNEVLRDSLDPCEPVVGQPAAQRANAADDSFRVPQS
jgi:hypothetical protein